MHNITINIETLEEKYYLFNTSFDFLIKQGGKGLETQFAVSRTPIDLFPLQEFVGFDISLDNIFVDTCDFQTNTYWLMTEGSSTNQQVKLYKNLLAKFEITEDEFLYWAGYLNSIELRSLEECAQQTCIACIRVPLQSNRLKIYARPFRYHQFPIDDQILNRAKTVLGNDKASFDKQLEAGGVSYDFSDGRIVFFTQNDELKKQR